MARDPHHEVMAERCDGCLYTGDRIVSGSRAAEIIRKCKTKDIHFECHKGSLAGRHIHCRAHFDTGVGQWSRIAERLQLLRWIDPLTLLECEPPEEHR